MKQITWRIQLFTKDHEIIDICNKYWQANDNDRFDYQYSPAQIGKYYDIKGPKIITIASSNSQMEINCDNHPICGNSIKVIRKRNEIKLSIYKEKGSYLCETCEQLKRIENLEISNLEAKRMMNYALKQKQWTILSKEQLNQLIIISQCKTKKDVVTNIFKKVKPHSMESILIWEYLERLDDLKLIWIERNLKNEIIHYHTLKRLESILELQFPENFSKELNLKNASNNKSQLRITLDPTHNRKSPNQPIYSGTHIVKTDIILKANKKYNYQIWDNDDGTKVFQLTDPDNINSYNQSGDVSHDIDDIAYDYYISELKLN